MYILIFSFSKEAKNFELYNGYNGDKNKPKIGNTKISRLKYLLVSKTSSCDITINIAANIMDTEMYFHQLNFSIKRLVIIRPINENSAKKAVDCSA